MLENLSSNGFYLSFAFLTTLESCHCYCRVRAADVYEGHSLGLLELREIEAMSLSIVKDSSRGFTDESWLGDVSDPACTEDALASHFTHVFWIRQVKLLVLIDLCEATRNLFQQGG